MYHFLHMVRDKDRSVILQVLQAPASSRTLDPKPWMTVPLSAFQPGSSFSTCCRCTPSTWDGKNWWTRRVSSALKALTGPRLSGQHRLSELHWFLLFPVKSLPTTGRILHTLKSSLSRYLKGKKQSLISSLGSVMNHYNCLCQNRS